MRSEKTKRVLSVIISIVLFAVLFANLYIIAARTVFKVSMPKILGFSYVKVLSGSMEPAIKVGDLLLIKKNDSYEKGNIITYSNGKSLITHRIIEVDKDKLITQGDANNTADPEVPIENVQGKVVAIIPGFGDILDFLITPLGFIILAGIIAFFTWFVFSAYKKKE